MTLNRKYYRGKEVTLPLLVTKPTDHMTAQSSSLHHTERRDTTAFMLGAALVNNGGLFTVPLKSPTRLDMLLYDLVIPSGSWIGS